MDKFENIIKEAVQGYEAPYDAQAWANVSSQLGNKGGAMKWIIGSAAAVVLITGTIYLMQDDETTPADITLTENTTQNTDDLAINPVVSAPVDLTDATTSDATIDNSNNAVTHGTLPVGNNNPSGTTQTGTTGQTSGAGNSNEGSTTSQTNPESGSTTTGASTNSEISVDLKTNPRFSASTNVACMTSEFIFTPEDMNQSVSYVWEFGDGTFSNSKIATHTYTRSGTFTVSLSLKDSKTNKTLSKSGVEVVVNPMPAVNFAWEQSNNLIPTISFINLTEDAQSFAWDIKGIRTSTDAQIDYTFRKKGTYVVELSAGNEFGCTSTIQKPIEVKADYNLLAPTAFSPNGDNLNDDFIPEALRIMDVDFTMVIYDKAGTLVYQTNDVNLPWNGINVNDNSQAEDGAYIWKVQFKNANGEFEMYEGQVIITR